MYGSIGIAGGGGGCWFRWGSQTDVGSACEGKAPVEYRRHIRLRGLEQRGQGNFHQSYGVFKAVGLQDFGV